MNEIDQNGISVNDLANSLGDDDGEFDERIEDEPEEESPESESDEEPEEGEPEEEEGKESESGEKLVIDGEEFDVPAELAPAAKKLKAFEESVRADYTRKTQEAAAMRQEATTIQQKVQQEARFYQANTDLLVEWKTLEAQLKEYEGVDWAALAEQDIGAYSRHKEIRDSLRERQQKVGNEFGQRKAAIDEQQAQEHAQRWQNTVNQVKTAIPNYDAAMDAKAVQAAVKLGEKYGFTVDPKELSKELNPLVWVGLVELSKHYDLIAKRPETAKRIAEAPKAQPKQGRPAPKTRHQEAEKRLKSGRGRIEDLAKFL